MGKAEVGAMTAHGDIIAFGFFALAVTVPFIYLYLAELIAAARERRRHNLAVERALARLPRCKFNEGGRS